MESTLSTDLPGQPRLANGTDCARVWPGGKTLRSVVLTGWAHTRVASTTSRRTCAVPPGLRVTLSLLPEWVAGRPTWPPWLLSAERPGYPKKPQVERPMLLT